MTINTKTMLLTIALLSSVCMNSMDKIRGVAIHGGQAVSNLFNLTDGEHPKLQELRSHMSQEKVESFNQVYNPQNYKNSVHAARLAVLSLIGYGAVLLTRPDDEKLVKSARTIVYCSIATTAALRYQADCDVQSAMKKLVAQDIETATDQEIEKIIAKKNNDLNELKKSDLF
ncbi:hypothetical protein KBC04_04800 [Candidatus Babeliales bacterium]|nr:hypothetical protein [Candidatus Babeliales bacterium]MBP9844349.1 hypothetical protein [Candidatus Babeliales bacterium]